jgi:hypothetical protein
MIMKQILLISILLITGITQISGINENRKSFLHGTNLAGESINISSMHSVSAFLDERFNPFKFHSPGGNCTGSLTSSCIVADDSGLQYLLSSPFVCCPEFILSDSKYICAPDGACEPRGTSDPGGLSHPLAACKNSFHTYTVFPNDPAYTYTWTITGGTPTSSFGNPVTIYWGNGTTGTIKVVISNLGSGGSCLDSITRKVCLIDGPDADFTMSDDTVCAGIPVQFTNTSIGGSVFHWNFGDGTTSNLATPPAHSYATSGNYTVTLIVQDMGSGQSGGSAGGQEKAPCGCIDTITKTIVVLPGNGPLIDYD